MAAFFMALSLACAFLAGLLICSLLVDPYQAHASRLFCAVACSACAVAGAAMAIKNA